MNVGGKLKLGWEELEKAIEECSEEANESSVHHTRTRSRRLEAIIRAMLIAWAGSHESMEETGRPLLRRLTKVRRQAGVVRDLDIHLKLIEALNAGREESSQNELLMRLGSELKQKRADSAEVLKEKLKQRKARIKDSAEKFLTEFADLTADEQQMDTFALAMGNVLEASAAIPKLRAKNLHEFRKRLKAARYIAELNPRSRTSVRLAKKLVRVQDAIGTWHDWDATLIEAKKTLRKKGDGLLREIRAKRKEKYDEALNVAQETQQELLPHAS